MAIGHLFLNGLEIGDRMAIGCNGFFGFSHAPQDSAALPLPAVERFRRMRALGVKNRYPGELQSFLKPGFAFIEAAEIPISIRECSQITDPLTDLGGLGERL